MNFMLPKWKTFNFLVVIIFLQFAVFTTVMFDIPVARQVICFAYFTFVPGIVFLKLLKLTDLDGIGKVLLVIGFSIAFLMLAGLLVNEFVFLLGVSRPLSLIPLISVLTGIILVGAILVYFRGEYTKTKTSNIMRDFSIRSLLMLCLPILSIIGALYVSLYGNNLLLLFAIISISLIFVFLILSKKILPSKLYPFAVLIIAIALLYHSSLISNYIVPFGSDVPGEYLVFKSTQNNAYWNSGPQSLLLGRYNDMMSVTILPTIYANILGLDSQWVFKLLYPVIFSFVALGLYQIWQVQIGKKYAFASAFLLMAQATFYTEMLGLNRQMIAELFFVLLLFVILNKSLKPVNKLIFFIIFSFALVVSHYAIAAIFLFFILLALVAMIILKRSSRNINVLMVVFFCAVMFAWYIFTSTSVTFNSFLTAGNYVFTKLSDFLNPASRGVTVMTGLGIVGSPSILNTISRIFAYLTQGLIVLGFIGFLTKRAKTRFEKEYLAFASTAIVLLAMLIIVPGLANTLNMTRFYHILLFFLAPFCIIGAAFIIKLLSKREKELAVAALLLVVLVPYFLFQTNFVYEVTKSDSWSIPLSGYRMDPLRLYGLYGYTDARSVYGAQWLSRNIDVANSKLYADERAIANVLTFNGLVYGTVPLSNVTEVAENGVVYLNTLNVVYGVIPYGKLSFNASEFSPTFEDLNIIYSNGGSEIYKNPS